MAMACAVHGANGNRPTSRIALRSSESVARHLIKRPKSRRTKNKATITPMAAKRGETVTNTVLAVERRQADVSQGTAKGDGKRDRASGPLRGAGGPRIQLAHPLADRGSGHGHHGTELRQHG